MIPYNLLLFFQLENYHITRFLTLVYQHFSLRIKGSQRQKLDWTFKATLLFIGSLGLFLWINGIIVFYFWYWVLLSLVISIALYPLILCLVAWVIFPIEYIWKYILITRAKKKVSKFPNLKIIGITGSYGKTSVKEYLKTLLEGSFKIIATPWTHNTPLGISKFILEKLNVDTEILLVEMGAYLPGDIKELCNIVSPTIAVITGITLQHLERFGSLDTIIQTKFEITQALGKQDMLFINTANEATKLGKERYCRNVDFSIKDISPSQVTCLPNFEWTSFVFEGVKYSTKLLGKHNATNIAFAISIAHTLGINDKILQERVKMIQFVPHRLELIKNQKTGVYVLDDSFNGNIEGIKATIALLTQTEFEGRKIYITPGLVELGEMSQNIHFEIGTLLAKVIDEVILIDSIATQAIKKWLKSVNFNEKNIHIFPSAWEAHKAVGKLLTRWDLVIFQNDRTDNYL